MFDSYADKGHPELPVLSATQDAGMVKRDEIGKSVFHDKSNEVGYKRVLPGQFVIHLRSFQGGFAHSNIEGITSPAYTIFGFKPSEKQYDLFWKYIFSSEEFVRRLETVTYGIRDGRSISYDEFLTMGFIVPYYEEQVKIAHGLIITDNLITLHQCKRAAFFDGERGLHSQFEGDKNTLAWEQRKLGEEVEITMGQSPDGSTYRETPAEYILVQGNADLKDGWVFPRVWTTQKTKTAEAGDLIMSVRAPAGAMGKTAYNVVLGRGVAAIKGNEFIFQTLVKMDSDGYWKKLAAGSTFESINSDSVSNAVISIPQQDDEQSKIGDLFESIDNLITLHQRGEKIYNRRQT